MSMSIEQEADQSAFDLISRNISGHGELDDDGRQRRSGTVWTALAHIITACIGAGVLSLAWAMSQLGWAAGISLLFIFSTISLFSANLLADCYRFPHPGTGKRNYSYMEAVKANLGGTMYLLCGWIQYCSLSAYLIGYTITTAKSLLAIQKSLCYKRYGTNATCKFSIDPHMVGFGIVEIFLSQIPNFHKLFWLSAIAAAMSFGYTLMGMGLSVVRIVNGQGGMTSITGVEIGEGLSASEKVWRMFAAAGDIAFACSYAQILFDIQDTLKSSPAENKVMKKANTIGISIMTMVFMMCSCLGYAAFGNQTPENLLAGFAGQGASWLVNLANLFIVVHLVGAFQVLGQPVFRVVESWASKKWPKSDFINREHLIKVGSKRLMNINLFRLSWRTSFVVLATSIGMTLPFFTDFLALLGALGYWPIVVYFPVEMHISQNKIPKATTKWFGLQILSFTCLIVSLAAASGAIQGLHKGLSTYKPLKSKE